MAAGSKTFTIMFFGRWLIFSWRNNGIDNLNVKDLSVFNKEKEQLLAKPHTKMYGDKWIQGPRCWVQGLNGLGVSLWDLVGQGSRMRQCCIRRSFLSDIPCPLLPLPTTSHQSAPVASVAEVTLALEDLYFDIERYPRPHIDSSHKSSWSRTIHYPMTKQNPFGSLHGRRGLVTCDLRGRIESVGNTPCLTLCHRHSDLCVNTCWWCWSVPWFQPDSSGRRVSARQALAPVQ